VAACSNLGPHHLLSVCRLWTCALY
jgi:hypothetical protein